jgi:hypothetical protein
MTYKKKSVVQHPPAPCVNNIDSVDLLRKSHVEMTALKSSTGLAGSFEKNGKKESLR